MPSNYSRGKFTNQDISAPQGGVYGQFGSLGGGAGYNVEYWGISRVVLSLKTYPGLSSFPALVLA